MTSITKLIENEITALVSKRNFKLKESQHSRSLSLFHQIIDEEDSLKRNEVISLIKNNEWEKPDSRRFYESLKKSKHGAMLTDYSPQELSMMKLFKLKGYDIGYALKKFNNKGFKEIVAVYNNSEVGGIGQILVQSAIKNGGCYLDHFDGMLSNLYRGMGFIEYNRDKYDPQYDPNNAFRSKYGVQDVIYRVQKNCQ
ncbi:MAG TPA: hypothetical protein VIK55_04930 [Paludibacter sp.]